MRVVGTIPGYVTEVQYLRHGRTPYYHTFTQPHRGRVRMLALSNGGVMLRGPSRIHADDGERGFERFVRRAAPRRNPREGEGWFELLVLAGVGYWLWTRARGSTMELSPEAQAALDEQRRGEQTDYS